MPRLNEARPSLYADPSLIDDPAETVPAEAAQRIANTGNTELIFYAICSPPFRDEAYVNLEKPA